MPVPVCSWLTTPLPPPGLTGTETAPLSLLAVSTAPAHRAFPGLDVSSPPNPTILPALQWMKAINSLLQCLFEIMKGLGYCLSTLICVTLNTGRNARYPILIK